MPKVSIIMGVYNINNENIIKPAIDSILKQTFTDYEFIICDDGSSDGTYEMIGKLTEKDSRVVLIKSEKNEGLGATLNKCLIKSQGKYIARMDADDISYSQRLEMEVEFLDKHNSYGMVGCNADVFDDSGIWGELIHIDKPKSEDFLFGSRFIHPTIMVRREIYEAVKGYRISKETIRGQDYDLFMRIYAMGHRGYNLQKKLYCYREDNEAYKKRTYKNRINEAIVRYKGFKEMNLLPKGYIYILKPLVVGLIPSSQLKIIKKRLKRL